MLIKKKLIKLPITEMPEDAEVPPGEYFSRAAVYECGKDDILALDIFDEGRKLKIRTFFDRKNWVNYYPNEKVWDSCLLNNALGQRWWIPEIKGIEADRKITGDFFGRKCWESKAASICFNWQCSIKTEKRSAAADRRIEREAKRLNMFEEPDPAMNAWLDKLLPCYAFMGKSIRKEREIYCMSCSRHYTVLSNTFRHREKGICPECGSEVVFYKSKYIGSIYDKIKVCDIQKCDGKYLVRWQWAYREFKSDHTLSYAYEPYRWRCSDTDRPLNIEWEYKEVKGYGTSWIKYVSPRWRWQQDEAYMYPRELSDMAGVGERYEDVFFERPIQVDPYYVARVYKQRPQMEYLIKLGLTKLAKKIDVLPEKARSFTELTGASKQYLPMYRKYNVDLAENKLITCVDFFVNEKMFEAMRAADMTAEHIANMRYFTDRKFSDRKIVNYMIRYTKKNPNTSAGRCVSIYGDYKRMLDQLGVERRTKNDYFPSDLNEYHDRLLRRVNKIKDEEENKAFAAAIKELYSMLPESYADKAYCIVLPQSATDFVKEGEALDICVGMKHYREEHARGEALICFVRHADAPETPYVCCEISMSSYKIVQIHGYGNDLKKPLPKEVRRFAEGYANAIKKLHRKRIKVSAA